MMGPDIETGDQRRDGSIGKLQCTGNMGWCIDLDNLAETGLALDHAFGEGNARGAGDAPDRTDHRDQRSQVVRSHIEEWSGTGLIEEIRIGMPAFGSMAHHKARSCYRRADGSSIYQIDAGLDAAA